MDEAGIEESLASYEAQLNQIQILMRDADPDSVLELKDLEKDLLELIEVTQDSLLSLKKSKLLSLLSAEPNIDSVDKTDDTLETSSCLSKSIEDEDLSRFDNFIGTKCRVKYTQDWGTFQYHNAMVIGVDEHEDESSGETVYKVRVVFLNPTHLAMVMCSYYLDGKCRFGESACKYSHGYLVNLEELEEYEEPDFSLLTDGEKCLAKYEDNGVWYKATVNEVFEETVRVHFDTYNVDATLDLHSVLPIENVNDNISGNDSSAESEVEDSSNVGLVELSYKPMSMSGPLGEWEEHTKGIGSKLMARMGYVFGKGLGRNGEGRVEPVEIQLLPPGKSLDQIMELKEKGKIKKPFKKKKKPPSVPSDESKTGSTKAAFDLINRIASKGKQTSNHSGKAKKQKFSVEESYKELKTDISHRKSGDVRKKSNADKTLNVQMLKVHEDISSTKKKLKQLRDSLSRNSRDQTVAQRIKYNIQMTESKLKELEDSEKSMQNKLNAKSQSKKLTVF